MISTNFVTAFIKCVPKILMGGCVSGKYLSKEIEDISLEESSIKIQTVMEVNDVKLKDKRTKNNDVKRKKRKKLDDETISVKSGHSRRSSKSNKSNKENKLSSDELIKAKYSIKDLIGKGTCSRVFRAEHKITKHPYALKVIEAASEKDMFEAELSVLRRVNHPNVVKLFEIVKSDRRIYMVMELATGGSLLDRLEAKGLLSEKRARSVMIMVLNGVKYLHNLGITHRDLKPDNLLYYHPGPDSRILICDFGLSSTANANGDGFMRTICGTPQYIAPEIALQRPYTCAIDMWAVGVITYVVLCGQFPFDGQQDTQILKLIVKNNINMNNIIWNRISREARLFILQLLQADPLRRLNAQQALAHDWLTLPVVRLKYSSGSSPNSSHGSSPSVGSIKSEKSVSSLRSGQHRVQIKHLKALTSDPDVAALL